MIAALVEGLTTLAFLMAPFLVYGTWERITAVTKR